MLNRLVVLIPLVIERGADDLMCLVMNAPDEIPERLPCNGSGIRKRRDILADVIGFLEVGLELKPFRFISARKAIPYDFCHHSHCTSPKRNLIIHLIRMC